MDLMAAEIVVLPTPAEQLPVALKLLYSYLPEPQLQRQVDRALRDAVRGQVDLSGLLSARQGDRLVGVLLTVEQPGRAAMVWPPAVCDTREAAEVANALLQAADRRLMGRGVRVLQALLDPHDLRGARCLVRNGYAQVAELVYLERSLEGLAASGGVDLQFATYGEARQALFESVVERTYADSLDAPELNGLRPIGDVLAGHRAVGVFDPARWLVALEQGEPVACLLMAGHPDMDAWEVVYVGVVPSARGRGLGRELTLEACRRARQAGARRLVLAVDAKNRFACNIYSGLDFQPWDRRCAYMRVLPNATD
jgi:ribosomal protein S18 acetylase RimI-like enzyme